mgnify:CR=1 FL=1
MFNQSVKIAFFGTSEFSVIVLDELKKLGVLPDIIVTVPDKPQGRKMILTPNETKVWAENNSIEYIEATKLKDEVFLKKIKDYNLFIVASYGKIIPKILIDMPEYKVLNIHPSLLPKYRGPSPLQTQILNNDKEVGVTIMLIDEEMDHGDVIAQKIVSSESLPVNFNTFQKMLGVEGSVLLAKILPDWIKGKIQAVPQKHSEATFTKKVEKIDGFLDLSKDQFQNYLKFLAYSEWPKTYFEIEKDGKKMRVIVKDAIWQDGLFKILKVVPEGKKEMDYKDFLRGIK